MTGPRVIVEADGGSRGNPGPAGFGALVRDVATGEILQEIAEGIGVASNNVAEYRGLIAGLTAALDLGATDVEVRMDSKLVVEQMSGRWQVKHPDMKVLARQAADLVRRLPSVRFTHIRREFNKHADRLANEAMDAAAAGRRWQAGSKPSPALVSAPPPAPARAAVANKLVGWASPASAATTGLLVRHGETPLSIDRKFNGANDSELTDRGSAQADAVARRLASVDVAAVVASPLRRTQQTAQPIAAAVGAPIVLEPGFAETDFGEWDKLSFGEVRERWPELLDAWLADSSVSPPGGESIDAVSLRVEAAQQRMVADFGGKTLVVVSHVTPIKTLVRLALGAPVSAIYRIHIEPASLSHIAWHLDHHPVVHGVNDTSHLSGVATPELR